MKHPERINPQISRSGRKLAPAGWTVIYVLAALMFGALAIFGSR